MSWRIISRASPGKEKRSADLGVEQVIINRLSRGGLSARMVRVDSERRGEQVLSPIRKEGLVLLFLINNNLNIHNKPLLNKRLLETEETVTVLLLLVVVLLIRQPVALLLYRLSLLRVLVPFRVGRTRFQFHRCLPINRGRRVLTV